MHPLQQSRYQIQFECPMQTIFDHDLLRSTKLAAVGKRLLCVPRSFFTLAGAETLFCPVFVAMDNATRVSNSSLESSTDSSSLSFSSSSCVEREGRQQQKDET
jgi:hypothetical protein